MNDRQPGDGRYSKVEREQRWTLTRVPTDAQPACEILDRYIIGTNLRLRRVETGQDITLKLCQKIRTEPTDPEVVKLTNIYLSVTEYAVLATLPAAELRKTRWRLKCNGATVSVDEFHGRHRGLLLAEVELGIIEKRMRTPAFAVREVTNDDRFSGGALAFASDMTLNALLQAENPFPVMNPAKSTPPSVHLDASAHSSRPHASSA